ncbi:septal ring lytic transglycosylase RlpA family protein [Labrys monachus]|uniref:Endolytic peptidoglycan transglycosylase RlpA n=1 Tax=Labrys monachus TaxID=217067 RepID=A0ABU0FB31_9HYPH|nr:septal ring lytic transglycosylase RlpA family protein [Labrys monachus]MDQ0391828.1 rare lipoprotein A [Labrys monachus]
MTSYTTNATFFALALSLLTVTGPALAGSVGVASYYGKEMGGRRTADGERFNPGGLTAAHRSLPFGTKLRVTNLRNGKTVVVRVSDRGPFARGRMIDLSYGAARAIDMLHAGTARVKISRLAER